ncbi:S-adenosyl-L-methionine-dependent methyltransferase [Corynascus similis CBS 632.67]
MTTPKVEVYGPGYHPSQTKHHEWRTVENSATHLLPHLERLGRANPRLRVLDVGAGSGTITASLTRYLPSEGTILATDVSDDILDRARTHAEAQGPDVSRRISFQRASVYELPFPDGAFDVVHAHQVLCHLASPAEAVREMLRVCAPGGVMSLRETDMGMWCFWPAREELEQFRQLTTDVLVANGGQAEGGRRLLSWVLQAGAERADVEAGFGTYCYSAPQDRRTWGGSMIDRLRTGQMRDKGFELGLVTERGIEEMIRAWEDWMAADDATMGIMNGEVIVKKK